MTNTTEPKVLPEGAPADPALQAYSVYQQDAMIAYAATNDVVLRCYESSIPVPQPWVNYRKILRSIMATPAGDAAKLPPVPPLPKELK